MKRYILFLLVAMLECGIMFSQNNRPLSPMLNIAGEFKRDYKDVKKGLYFAARYQVEKADWSGRVYITGSGGGRRGAGRYSYGGIGCTEAYSRR